MIIYLIDYENVSNSGMRGCNYLDKGDYVILFYSDARKHVERRTFDAITASGCTFEICKLCKAGKNALDFYIVSRLGELIGSGYEGLPVIVSQDGGFQSVRDYWGKRSPRRKRIVLSQCIEDGIVSGNENNQRTKELRKLRENLNLEKQYSAYAERIRIKNVLEELFEGTEYEAMTEEIQGILEGKEKNSRVIYLSSLHLFGRKNGLAIYNKIKNCKELSMPYSCAE